MVYRFGAYELDEARGELRRDGRPVAIQPKPLALLALLLRERERVVPSDEILATLWPDTVVTPGSLNRAVTHARRAIGDTHRAHRIRSISRRGYRFAGEVIALEPAGTGANATPAPERPFVGRAEALAPLREARARALRRREGAGVLVAGRYMVAALAWITSATAFGTMLSQAGSPERSRRSTSRENTGRQAPS